MEELERGTEDSAVSLLVKENSVTPMSWGVVRTQQDDIAQVPIHVGAQSELNKGDPASLSLWQPDCILWVSPSQGILP